jgi:hypothetical protein
MYESQKDSEVCERFEKKASELTSADEELKKEILYNKEKGQCFVG